MLPYQEEYIKNCKAHQDLTFLMLLDGPSFDAAMENMRQAAELALQNTLLLREQLLPVLDELYQQDDGTLADMEAFADALTSGPRPLDLALAEQIHDALLSGARYHRRRDMMIRELYKLGMVRYQMWNMLTGLDLPETDHYSIRMRYCFTEAASYLKYYEEFDETTLSYILRSMANTYMGQYDDWRERLNIVRHTMKVFNDDRYRAAAPNLPWDKYIYLIHRQMVSVMPYNFPEGTLSPDAVQDVMESAHLIYELQYEQAAKSGKPLHAHRLMPYYSIEYACGLISKEELLSHMEWLMDEADPTDYGEPTDYRIISMPVFYVQYLRNMPEMVPPRRSYITQLYLRLLLYVKSMPQSDITEQTYLYIRQLLSMFMEIEDGVSYRDMALYMSSRFSPEIYSHGYTVGRMAQAICGDALSADPGYFDDIPEIASLQSAEEKLPAISDLAFNSGLFHDIGKLSFTSLYNHAGRQMLGSEEEALQLHAEAGHVRLAEYPSTRPYADAAWGHHRWYDGSDGYPKSYKRGSSPYRALVDIIAFADFLDSEGDDDTSLPIRTRSFDEKLAEARKLGGRRFSPLVTGGLRDPKLLEALEYLYNNGRRDGYYHCFHRIPGLQEQENETGS